MTGRRWYHSNIPGESAQPVRFVRRYWGLPSVYDDGQALEWCVEVVFLPGSDRQNVDRIYSCPERFVHGWRGLANLVARRVSRQIVRDVRAR